MLAHLKHRLTLSGAPFLALMASDALTLMSMMVGMVAVPWWIVQHGGAGHLAVYGVTLGCASFLSIPLVAPFGDRIPKRQLIAAGLCAYAAEAVALAVLATNQLYSLPLLIALEIIPVLAISVIVPAMATLAAELVPPEQLSSALGLQKSAQAAGRLLGPALSGVLLAAFPIAIALWAHALLLGVSILLAARLPLTPCSAAHDGAGLPRWWRDLKAGLRANLRIPLERNWTLVNFLSWIFSGPAFGMLVPVKVKSLGLSGAWLGACEAALSLGMLAGALGGANWLIARYGRYHTRIVAAASRGILLAVAGFTHQPVVLVVCFLLAGIGNSAEVLVGMTHRTLARPPAFRSRMASTGMMITQVASAMGPALAGVALLHAPVDLVYGVFGVLAAFSALLLVRVTGFRDFMALDHHEVTNWYGKHYPEAFRDH